MTADTSQGWERLATNLRVEQSLLEVLGRLDGLPVVVFKGTPLTRLLYGDLRARASSDNDLWVPRPHIYEALQRLLSLGYKTEPLLDPHAELRRLGQVPLWLHGDYSQVAVDLHADPFSSRYFSVDEATLQQHLIELKIQDRQVMTFDRPLALCHLVAHAVQHHFEVDRVRDLAAAWNAWGAEVDSSELESLVDETCGRASFEYGLWAASQHGLVHRPAPEPRVARVKWMINNVPVITDGMKELFRKFLTLAIVAPRRLPRGIWRALFLEEEELVWRYGQGNRPAQLMRHVGHILRR